MHGWIRVFLDSLQAHILFPKKRAPFKSVLLAKKSYFTTLKIGSWFGTFPKLGQNQLDFWNLRQNRPFELSHQIFYITSFSGVKFCLKIEENFKKNHFLEKYHKCYSQHFYISCKIHEGVTSLKFSSHLDQVCRSSGVKRNKKLQ